MSTTHIPTFALGWQFYQKEQWSDTLGSDIHQLLQEDESDDIEDNLNEISDILSYHLDKELQKSTSYNSLLENVKDPEDIRFDYIHDESFFGLCIPLNQCSQKEILLILDAMHKLITSVFHKLELNATQNTEPNFFILDYTF
tara:strand:+ start:245 stop:670 length:426 start_codon:yes stop_codon:yes gene_type:complete